MSGTKRRRHIRRWELPADGYSFPLSGGGGGESVLEVVSGAVCTAGEHTENH